MNLKYQILVFLALFSTVCFAQHSNPIVKMQTDYGDIVLELFADHAPVTVDNFLSYVASGFYDLSIIHRVDNNLSYSIIQGGGWGLVPEAGQLYQLYPDTPIVNESYNGLSNERGTIAMARSMLPDSAAAQFFINQRDDALFDKANYSDGYGYCVFGKVIEGMWLVDAISTIEPNDFLCDPKIYPDITKCPLYQLPYPPLIVLNEVTALPCDVSYCVNYEHDEIIDFADYSAFASQWGETDCNSANFFCSDTDLDFDGTVGLSDLAIFFNKWLVFVGSEPVLSDFDFDGSVGILDLGIFAQSWLSSDCSISNSFCNGVDLNQDTKVDLLDYELFANNWLIQIE